MDTYLTLNDAEQEEMVLKISNSDTLST